MHEKVYHFFSKVKDEQESLTAIYFSENDMIEVYDNDHEIKNKSVKKTGKTTGETQGLLNGKMNSIKIERPADSYKFYTFNSVYVVDKKPGQNQLFSEPGDSGSGVFVVEDGKPDKALGIAIANTTISQETYVCKISNILKTLGLKLVKYRENNKEQPLPCKDIS